MAKIVIAGVKKGEKNYTVHVVLTEPQQTEMGLVDVALGEAFVPAPHGMEMADIRDRIKDAAEGIMDAHKDALDKKRDIEECEFPEIT